MTAERALGRLAEPACFPHAPRTVRLVQTHLSVVCLADDLVYKLKKAVTLPFVDFAPLAARRQACRDEVRLNRRLCPDTYLGTASLRPGPDGALRFAATGDDDGPDDVDVAVVMRRLPQERMLDELLRTGTVTTAAIEALARHIAAFHARCERPPVAAAVATASALAGFAADNFRELAAIPGHGLPPALLQATADASREDFTRILPSLVARAARGCVVDGHGDLHARNVCMTEPPTIYDCIEFAPAFRIGDVATEIAFLAMDLRYRGAADLATACVRAYAAARQDAELPSLLPTLCGYRAMVRAKVAALAAAESELPAEDRASGHRSARQHLSLAAALAAETRGPWWLVVCGPPASGKSRLCTALATAVQWPHLATDVVRKELAQLPPTAHAAPEHYTPEFSRRTYDELRARAAAATLAGAPVVLLDGNFPTAATRLDTVAAGNAVGARCVIAHVDVDAATAIARATQRAREGHDASDADAEVTAARHASFAAPRPEEGLAVLRLDGHRASDELAAMVLTHLLAGPSRRDP